MAAASTSRHFTLEPIADGAWAALHRVGGWAVGNAAVVDLGGRSLVVDTFLTRDAARDLQRACVELTGRAADVVVNTHYHNDHTRGNEVFEGATLVATCATRRLLDEDGREELAWDRAHAAERLEALRADLDSDDPLRREAAAYFVPYWQGLVASAPGARIRLPDLAVEGELELHGARRRARLVSLGRAHSGDDAIVVLPDDGVVVCGDLLFVESHPFLADGDPDGAREALAALLATGADTLVPGHGRVGGPPDVRALLAYLDALEEAAAGLPADDPDAVAAVAVPRAFAHWTFAHPFYAANLRFLLARRGAAA